jgi:hypothetical protein
VWSPRDAHNTQYPRLPQVGSHSFPIIHISAMPEDVRPARKKEEGSSIVEPTATHGQGCHRDGT